MALGGRRGRPQGVPAQAGPARRGCSTELPEVAEPIVPARLGRTQHDHHRLRPRPRGRAAAGGRGRRRAGQWRHLITPTFLRRDERGGQGRGHRSSSRRPARRCATSCASTPRSGSAAAAPTSRAIYVGGKTGTAEKVIDGRYSKNQLFTTFMAIVAGGQAEIRVPDHHRRAAGTAGDLRLRHRRPGTPAPRRATSSSASGRCSACTPRFDPPTAPFPRHGPIGTPGARDETGRRSSRRTARDSEPAWPRRAARSSPGVTADSRKARVRACVFFAVPGHAGRRPGLRRARGRGAAPSLSSARAACRRPAGCAAYARVPDVASRAGAGRRALLSGASPQRSSPSPARAARPRSPTSPARSSRPAATRRRSLGTIGVVSADGAVYGSLTTPDPVDAARDAGRARRARASPTSPWRPPRTASTSAGSTACGSRPPPSPISAAIISTITRRWRTISRPSCGLFDTLLPAGGAPSSTRMPSMVAAVDRGRARARASHAAPSAAGERPAAGARRARRLPPAPADRGLRRRAYDVDPAAGRRLPGVQCARRGRARHRRRRGCRRRRWRRSPGSTGVKGRLERVGAAATARLVCRRLRPQARRARARARRAAAVHARAG